MNRRIALLAGAAAAATAAGVGMSLWRAGTNSNKPTVDIWPMRFDKPGGGELTFAGLRGRPLVLNFWATWCPPCVSELPLLDRFHAEQQARGWQVIGLAVDQRAPVLEFLAKQPVSFAVGLAGLEGVELSRGLGNSAGALPFTVVFNRSGDVSARKLGIIQAQDLQAWVAAAG